MTATGVNARYLPGVPLLSNVRPVADPAEAQGTELILAVVPAQALRPVLEIFAPYVADGVPIVVCAKGIEHATGRFLSEVAAEICPVIASHPFRSELCQGGSPRPANRRHFGRA